eukprot:Gb_17550 [translate_table: standard]
MQIVDKNCYGRMPVLCEKSMPILAMIFVQFGYAGVNIISKVAFDHGMNYFVLVVYRHIVAGLFTLPFVYFFERNNRPKFTFPIFGLIFLSALFGGTTTQILFYSGLSFTSPTFACALLNMVPAVTFAMAILFRIDKGKEAKKFVAEKAIDGHLPNNSAPTISNMEETQMQYDIEAPSTLVGDNINAGKKVGNSHNEQN